MSNKKTSLAPIIDKLTATAAKFRRYSFLAFIIFVALLYGFILYRSNSLAGVQPSDSDVSSQVKAAQVPHIDQAVVSQLQSLQDNSVSVQTLFDQARSSPFQ